MNRAKVFRLRFIFMFLQVGYRGSGETGFHETLVLENREKLNLMVLLILLQTLRASGDYSCICSNHIQRSVYTQPDEAAELLGYLYEFDCKPKFDQPNNQAWAAIAFYRQIGYVLMDAQMKETTCAGDIPTIDLVPVSTTITTTTTTTPTETTTTITSPIAITTTLSTNTVGLVFGQVNLCPRQLTRNLLGQIGRSCYELVPQKVDWYTANINCLRKQAFLFHVLSDAENQVVLSMLTTFQQTDPVWTGLEDVGVEGVYKWVSGDPVVYTNWIPNHLSPDADQEDCVIFLSRNGGRWDDVACRGYLNGNQIHPFICQYKI